MYRDQIAAAVQQQQYQQQNLHQHELRSRLEKHCFLKFFLFYYKFFLGIV